MEQWSGALDWTAGGKWLKNAGMLPLTFDPSTYVAQHCAASMGVWYMYMQLRVYLVPVFLKAKQLDSLPVDARKYIHLLGNERYVLYVWGLIICVTFEHMDKTR